MRVLLLTHGTEGDVRPFIALARGLIVAGHEAAVCAADGFAPLVEGAGVDFRGFGNDLYEAMRAAMEDSDSVTGLVRHGSALIGATKASLPHQWEVARAYVPDLIVFHPKPLSGPHIAEALGVPGVLSLPIPLHHATRAWAPPLWSDAPRWAWPVLHRAMASSAGAYGAMANGLRRRIGLRGVRWGSRELTTPEGRPRHVLYPYSPTFVPTPDDFPPTAHVTGYWFLDGDADPPPELVEFVAAGRPDVYLGFGSMALGGLREQLSDAVSGALRRTGLRAVVGAGWGGVSAEGLTEGTLAVGHVPHDWLLPRVGAAVHHGGAGTVGATLRAGRPSLVCPLLGDQPWWGQRIHAGGLGPAPIPMKSLTADTLAAGLERLVADPPAAERAAALGARIRAEDGIGQAIRVLESIAPS